MYDLKPNQFMADHWGPSQVSVAEPAMYDLKQKGLAGIVFVP